MAERLFVSWKEPDLVALGEKLLAINDAPEKSCYALVHGFVNLSLHESEARMVKRRSKLPKLLLDTKCQTIVRPSTQSSSDVARLRAALGSSFGSGLPQTSFSEVAHLHQGRGNVIPL